MREFFCHAGRRRAAHVLMCRSPQAQHIKENLKPGQPHKPLSGDAGAQTLNNLDWVRNSNGNRTVADLRLEMQKVMQSDAAVFRTEESVRRPGPLSTCLQQRSHKLPCHTAPGGSQEDRQDDGRPAQHERQGPLHDLELVRGHLLEPPRAVD